MVAWAGPAPTAPGAGCPTIAPDWGWPGAMPMPCWFNVPETLPLIPGCWIVGAVRPGPLPTIPGCDCTFAALGIAGVVALGMVPLSEG